MHRVAHIPRLTDQHAGEAAFLWHRRRIEVDGHRLDEIGIGRLDLRLDANMDGLSAAGIGGWQAAEAAHADFQDAGECFVLAALALASGEAERVVRALDLTAADGAEADRGWSGAVARVGESALKPYVAGWLASREDRLRRLALAALVHRRVDPGPGLAALLADPSPWVRARALRLAGRLRRRDLTAEIRTALTGETDEVRFEAAFAGVLVGDAAAAIPVIDALARAGGPYAAAAIELRLLLTPADAGRLWLRERLAAPATAVIATAAVGIPGDPVVMPWLIGRMREPAVAVAAGAALRDLFPIAFDETALFTGDGASLGPGFADLSDPAIPVADAVAAWWGDGTRPPDGRPFRSMRHRRLDALRRAVTDPAAPLEDWRIRRDMRLWM